MSKKSQTPPRWMDRIIEWYCKPHLLEDLQGDIHEYYARNLKKGRFIANLIFFIDVLKFYRTYTVRKPKIFNGMKQMNLLKNYFKTSTRSLVRNKLFSSINVIGMAISMSVGILMITYLNELLSFDRFHENADRIYRVQTTYKGIAEDWPAFDLASTSVFIGKKLQEEYPDIEEVVIMRRNFRADLLKDENAIAVRGLYSSREFFDVFSFDLIAGDRSTALEEPNSIVLTKESSEKLFKDKNPVGEIVKSGNESFTITGVIENPPSNSHLQFEVLASFSTIENKQRVDNNSSFFSWGSVWMNYAYLLLPDGHDTRLVESNLDKVAKIENTKSDRFTINLHLENILDIVPGRDLSNQIGPSMNWTDIYQLSGLILIVIISTCFNYTNLSMARSLRRAKEVGIRKIVGASRTQVFTQFVLEAIIISLLALIFSYGLYLFIKPHFIALILEDRLLNLNFELVHLFYFLVFSIVIGFVAGVLPSIFLSKLKAISILRDVTKVRFVKRISLRKVLIVFQFTISIVLIIGATVSYRQYKYSLNFDLGYTTKNILNVPLHGNEPNVILNEVTALPDVARVSQSGMILSTGDVWAKYMKHVDPLDSAKIFYNYVDEQYLEVHQFELLAGSNFYSQPMNEASRHIIVNELLVKRFGFDNPEDAIGQKLSSSSRNVSNTFEIIGVVKDFQYQKISGDETPNCFIQGSTDDFSYLNLVVKTNDVISLVDKLDEIWKAIDKVHPFEAVFYDDLIQEAYSEQATMFKVFGFLAVLAISIASMGLLGMAVFTTETRIREISIRKIMGANEKQLVYILSSGFILMLIASTIIAIPSTYLLFELVILADYANRITIGAFELLAGVALIFGLGLITIGWQTLKTAKSNPVEILRNE